MSLTSEASFTPEVRPILMMVESLESLGLAELERALRLRLFPAETPSERRVAELGFLAKLLDELPLPDDDGTVPFLSRTTYEARQPLEAPDAPDARRLVDKHHSWRRVCRAAYGLLPDGRTRGKSAPWVSSVRGERRTAAYTRDEVQRALKMCVLELGRTPDASAYHRWSSEEKRSARCRGATVPRLPSLKVIYRHYPKGENRWRQAINDALLVEADIARSRVERLLRLANVPVLGASALEAFTAADATVLAEIGIDAKRRSQLECDGFGFLCLDEATGLAHLLGGSLDWLGGLVVERGQPPASALRFDPAALRALQEQHEIPTRELIEKRDMAQGPWRRLMNGKDKPHLYELVILAAATKTAIEALLV